MKNEFKVGDRVRVVSLMGYDEESGLRIGMVGTIVSERVRNVTCIVAFENFSPLGDSHVEENGYIMRYGQMELAETENGRIRIEPIPLKVGDRVEYTGRFNGMDMHMVGFRGTVANEGGCFLPEGCRVDWDNSHELTGVFKGNLRKLEPWEVAVESGEFHFIYKHDTSVTFCAAKQGNGWRVTWEGSKGTFFPDDVAIEAFRDGNWVLTDAPPLLFGHTLDAALYVKAAIMPDPVAEAAAAYKAAHDAFKAAEKVNQEAREALRDAEYRQSEAFNELRKAELKLMEASVA